LVGLVGTKKEAAGDRALARLVRSAGVRRPPVAGSSAARPGFPTGNSRFPIKFCCLSRVEPQRDCDASVAYGALDGPGDLTKDVI